MPGEVIFADEADVVVARRWCWRQSAASAAREDTTDILVTVEGHHEGATADVNDALLDAKTVYISAAEGIGLNKLLTRIDSMIEEDRISRVRLRIPQKEGKTLAILEAQARIYSRKYKDGAVELEADAPESVVRRVREWIISK